MQVYDGDAPLTISDAKELLGWATPPEGVTKGVFKLGNVRAWMSRNNINRPLYMSQVYRYRQDILRRKWRMNGEPIIVGKYGNILNGQHTLIALVLSGVELEEHPGKWKDYWQSEPTIDKVCVFGVEEDDEVINTMDTCKPRSLADVIYRSPYFANVATSKRRSCARALDYAVRLIWHRTGASSDAFKTTRTHSEAIDFVERHPKIVEAVSFIIDEDVDGSISRKWLSPGYSAAMLYLMGACKSDPKVYRQEPSEQSLDLSMWDEACDYWVALSQGTEEVKPLKAALAKMQEPTWRERTALIAKGWMCIAMGRKLGAKELKLVYTDPEGEEGFSKLAEMPTVGGIDQGDPEPEDVGGEKKFTKPKSKPQKVSKANPNRWTKGDAAWIEDEDEWFFATLAEDPLTTEQGTMVTVTDEDGNNWEVPLESVHTTKSEAA